MGSVGASADHKAGARTEREPETRTVGTVFQEPKGEPELSEAENQFQPGTGPGTAPLS